MKLGKLSLEKAKKDKELYLEKLNIFKKKNKEYSMILNSFLGEYKDLRGTEYKFQEKRVTREGKKLPSDLFRIKKIFAFILFSSKNNHDIACNIMTLMVRNWSDWEKAHHLNLMGFLENLCDEENFGNFYMKAKKSIGNKKGLHNEEHRINVKDKQRSLFED